jgi:hypothetical protein
MFLVIYNTISQIIMVSYTFQKFSVTVYFCMYSTEPIPLPEKENAQTYRKLQVLDSRLHTGLQWYHQSA